MAQQIATIIDGTTLGTELPRPSTDDLDLTALPSRLDDTMLARVEAIAAAPLPTLQPCDSQRFGQALRMMLAVLPRRQADEVSGELFVAAYERALGGYPAAAIDHLCDKAIRSCRWFPTVAECIEILSTWVRRDAATERKGRAEDLARRERGRRLSDGWTPPPGPALTQSAIDFMPQVMRDIGVKCGAIVQDEDGTYRPAPDEGR